MHYMPSCDLVRHCPVSVVPPGCQAAVSRIPLVVLRKTLAGIRHFFCPASSGQLIRTAYKLQPTLHQFVYPSPKVNVGGCLLWLLSSSVVMGPWPVRWVVMPSDCRLSAGSHCSYQLTVTGWLATCCTSVCRQNCQAGDSTATTDSDSTAATDSQ